eukprot:3717813-Pyramimonas_sp.AAC.1
MNQEIEYCHNVFYLAEDSGVLAELQAAHRSAVLEAHKRKKRNRGAKGVQRPSRDLPLQHEVGEEHVVLDPESADDASVCVILPDGDMISYESDDDEGTEGGAQGGAAEGGAQGGGAERGAQ